MNNIFTPLAVTIIPVGPDGESPPRDLRQIDVDIAVSHIRGPCEQLGGGRLGVTYLLTVYLCELSLMNVRLKRFEPSMVAAAALHLALHTRNRSAWSMHLTARYRIFLVTTPKTPSHS